MQCKQAWLTLIPIENSPLRITQKSNSSTKDILNRFKRADLSTTYVAVLVFFIRQHNFEEFCRDSRQTSTENIFFQFTL